jgi:hyperosmotically inducible periplasmic protein
MRIPAILIALSMLTACAAAMVGGGATGGYDAGTGQRDTDVVATDSAITTRIKAKIAADSVVGVYDIGVYCRSGKVTLTGKVGNRIARDAAGALAKNTTGVVSVDNQVKIE